MICGPKKIDTTNPKDKLGEKKVSITKIPPVAILHTAAAMVNGADKYGPYNWREKNVISHIYIDAAMRHLMSWWEGEEKAEDSGVHHLGHVMACCAILLDAQANNNLIDDRPKTNKDVGWFSELLESVSKSIKRKQVSKDIEHNEEINSKTSTSGSISACAPNEPPFTTNTFDKRGW